MISKKMEEALNEQVNAELYSAYLYLSMESYFKSQNLNGFANWMRVQTQEEVAHATKIYDFINERGGRVTLKAIEGPQTEWDSALAVFKAAYEHEQKVTGLINNLVDLAIKEKDHATNSFLQWFVNEQVEEEASADEIVQQLKMMENAPGGMFMLDRELGQRVFTPPATEGA
ncbi:MAG: ferritin [Planctomycetes bacterium]|nr:ferritin [Planctomycetota bacterium]MBL7146155.1 ferritin [Phycisphaerae bacterium]